MSILGFLLIGLIAGWIAAQLTHGHGFGLVTNLVIGVVGAVIGGMIFRFLGVSVYGGAASALVMAVIGAVVLLVCARFLKRV